VKQTPRKYRLIKSPVPHAQAFALGNGITIFRSHENGSWHLSIAHPKRNPSWKELHDIRYDLVPEDAYMALILPPRREYVNLHEHCFHLWEVHGSDAERLVLSTGAQP